jgi:pyrimidine operon attenuation protein/uracil phosphoribosyltransferase
MGRSLAKKGAQKTGGIALMGIKSGGGTVANKVKSMFSRNNQDPQGE